MFSFHDKLLMEIKQQLENEIPVVSFLYHFFQYDCKTDDYF